MLCWVFPRHGVHLKACELAKPDFAASYSIWIYFDSPYDFLTVERHENYYLKLEREKLKAD